MAVSRSEDAAVSCSAPRQVTRLRRWLYQGLHSLDFPFLYYRRPLWDIVVIVLSIGGIALSVTTMAPAWRRLARHVRRWTSRTSRRREARQIAAVVVALCIAGAVPRPVAAQPATAPTNVTRGCIDRVDPSKDYFPDKVTVDDAVNFSVTYHRSYKIVQTRATAPPNSSERYVLVQCGTPAPPLQGALAGAQVVDGADRVARIRRRRTHLPLLVDLQRLDVLTGVSTQEIPDRRRDPEACQ